MKKKKKLEKISSGLSFDIDGEDDEDDFEPEGLCVRISRLLWLLFLDFTIFYFKQNIRCCKFLAHMG